MSKDLFWCSNCLAMSTRPRIKFDSEGVCNACQWSNTKKTMDWSARQEQLQQLLGTHRSSSGKFDCVVPVSGGKDGSYVAYNLKHKYGMNPLCVTIEPPLPLEIGQKNLRNFINSGYDHITINTHPGVMQKINKYGLIEMGFPYYGWLIAVEAIPAKIAHNFGISLIVYGEDGEVEYGGSTETSEDPSYSIGYQKEVYLEAGFDKVLDAAGVSPRERELFEFLDEEVADKSSIQIVHWSYFENWDPYRNYLIAKEHCGLTESDFSNNGSFTNFAQNDQALYALHTYLMYLKFGFGRANQDACIEIRRGAMDRDQAINLVRIYDGQYPEEFIPLYLDYFQIDSSEFQDILDKWANKDIFEKIDGIWQPNFQIV